MNGTDDIELEEYNRKRITKKEIIMKTDKLENNKALRKGRSEKSGTKRGERTKDQEIEEQIKPSQRNGIKEHEITLKPEQREK